MEPEKIKQLFSDVKTISLNIGVFKNKEKQKMIKKMNIKIAIEEVLKKSKFIKTSKKILN